MKHHETLAKRLALKDLGVEHTADVSASARKPQTTPWSMIMQQTNTAREIQVVELANLFAFHI